SRGWLVRRLAWPTQHATKPCCCAPEGPRPREMSREASNVPPEQTAHETKAVRNYCWGRGSHTAQATFCAKRVAHQPVAEAVAESLCRYPRDMEWRHRREKFQQVAGCRWPEHPYS